MEMSHPISFSLWGVHGRNGLGLRLDVVACMLTSGATSHFSECDQFPLPILVVLVSNIEFPKVAVKISHFLDEDLEFVTVFIRTDCLLTILTHFSRYIS